jgi:glycosyltransferase involved in cell wall biosynthesis
VRVLLAVDGLGTGGAERSLAELLPRLTDEGIDPTVVCLRHRREGVEGDVVAAGFDVRFLKGSNLVTRVVELSRIIERERPDLVHTSLVQASILGRLAAVREPVPVLTSLTSTPYAPVRLRDPMIHRLPFAAVRTIDGWSARHLTDHFHAISQAVGTAAVRSLGISPGRVTVIPRGRDPARLGAPGQTRRGRVRRSLGLRPDDEVLIAVGRQEFLKGHRFLLEAAEMLRRSHPRLVVLVAGRRGTESDRLGRLHQRPGVRDVVRFLGYRDDVPDLLAASDLFVFPSLSEGLGGALIEAMALGLPIVASNIDAIREVVEPERNALLVRPGGTLELAGAVEALLDDPERREVFGVRSRWIFEERFTIDRSVERMIELYRVVARPPARGRRPIARGIGSGRRIGTAGEVPARRESTGGGSPDGPRAAPSPRS